ncbi:putative late blight resistance protein homolog R1B-8 [Salvia miltiorrhiza]|uniref:putative late blight resistance protein homolog R1B-8 n=1 Tax=Salvia miltiorrhiza TaxID=226208 RepID=UPI0025AD03F2|nr:putative late blight resistance protein homolog R1B-8 [Salvia miltiorrhiza]
MAYSTLALVSLEKTINHFLHHNQFSISPHEKQQILSLDKYVVSFLYFLEDFGGKATPLEARIRDVAVEAEDAIEWHMWVKIRYNFRYTLWIAKLIRGIKFIFQLRRVIDQMDSIAAEVVEIKNTIIIEGAKLDDPVGASSSSSQDANAGNSHVVGLDKDLRAIQDWLCGDSRQLQILPVTGMGGIGKTTLATNAFDHPLIMEHFDIRAWVTISQDYSQERLLSDLLDAMKEFDPGMRKKSVAENSQQGNESRGEESNGKEAENSQQGNESRGEESYAVKAHKVHKILIGRRFLIVMDDVWSTEVLDGVKNLFPDYNDGSRVLLTTRLADVASYAASSTSSHEMRLMDADQSWNLLRQKVFAHQDDIPPELETIGREIARSCGGLPLAMVVAAGVLSTTSRTVTSWSKFY